MKQISALEKKYHDKVKKSLLDQFSFKSPMQIPRIEKVIINMTAGNQVNNSKIVEEVAYEIEKITGQKPVETRAKKSLASWKLREGMPMGSKVTLRRDKMWYFLDKLINIVIPRIRDFRGVNPQAFDGRGNFSLGIKEQIIFPEIDFDKVKKLKGLDVIVVTSTNSDEQARELLSQLGVPFKKWKAGNK